MKNEALLQIFAPNISRMLAYANLSFAHLQEIRLRVHCPLLVIYDGVEWMVNYDGSLHREVCAGYRISEQDLRDTLQIVSSYSLYAFEEEVRQGFLTIAGGHRVGMAGRTIVEQGHVRGMKYISFLNVRLAHQVKGCADQVLPHLVLDGQPLSTLIVSAPRCGKTTLLRDLVRLISDGTAYCAGRTVGVVDERSEIGGCHLGVPQNDVGMRTDILDCCPKAAGMMMLVRSMAPEIVAVDEIGDARDADAIAAVTNCGCGLLATVHGQTLEDICTKPLLSHLLAEKAFARFVFLHRTSAGQICAAVCDAAQNVLFEGVLSSC